MKNITIRNDNCTHNQLIDNKIIKLNHFTNISDRIQLSRHMRNCGSYGNLCDKYLYICSKHEGCPWLSG